MKEEDSSSHILTVTAGQVKATLNKEQVSLQHTEEVPISTFHQKTMIPCSPLATKPQRDNYTYPAQELSISTSAKVEALRFKNFDNEKIAVFRKSGNRHRMPAYHRMAEVVGRDLWKSSG